MSSVIFQQESPREIRVLDEIVLPTSSTPEVCREFLSRYGKPDSGKHDSGPSRRLIIYGDASGSTAHTVTGSSDYFLIRSFFRALPQFHVELRVPAANPPVRDRVNAVNAKFLNAAGERSLFVHPHCRELIADLEQVSFKPGTSQIDKESDPKRTHLSDALGYVIWYEWPLRAPVGERNQRLI